MRINHFYWGIVLLIGLTGCSAVKMPNVNSYQLKNFSTKKWSHPHAKYSIYVPIPEAVAGYQTSNMLYIKKPFSLQSFIKNNWVDAPAAMLHPLLIESLQRSAYFQTVVTEIYSEAINYRLDTQLLKLHQNFIRKPSVIEFSAKIVLTKMDKNQLLNSRIINLEMPCTEDSPYGGVIAANKVSEAFTAAAIEFVIKNLK